MRSRATFLICACVAAAGCAQVRKDGPVLPRPPVDASLGPGDVFDVRVFSEPELSGTYRIDQKGAIDFPLIGKVEVTHRFPDEIAAMLRERLAAYVNSPAVSVFVREVNSKRVTVYGQVQRPGTFPYSDPMTLAQAISLAGGFTSLAAKDKVRIRRIDTAGQRTIQVDLRAIAEGRAPNEFVIPADEVYVPERVF